MTPQSDFLRQVANYLFLLFALLITGLPPCFAQSASAHKEILGKADLLMRQAQGAQAEVFAPSAYAKAVNLYQRAVESFQSGERGSALRAQADLAARSLSNAIQSAEKTKVILGTTVTLREEFLKAGYQKTAPDDFSRADQFFQEAIRESESGNSENAKRGAELAANSYRQGALNAMKAGSIFQAEQNLPAIKPDIPSEDYAIAAQELERAKSSIAAVASQPFDIADTALQLDKLISNIFNKLYPPGFLQPPQKLIIGSFILYVDTYQSLRWDFHNHAIVSAKGTAWTSCTCDPFFPFPFAVGDVVSKQFVVVARVRDPLTEITVEEAQQIRPDTNPGDKIILSLPKGATTPASISDSLQKIIGAFTLRKGSIKVSFDNLTIKLTAQSGVGLVTAGSATYPTTPPVPSRLSWPVHGFTLLIDQLVLTPTSATAQAILQFPDSIIDPGTGHPGQVSLANLVVNSQCQFHRELPSDALGPWSIGNTGMIISGTGLILDFSPSWVWSSAPPNASSPFWEGAILINGTTVAATSPIVSNTGYLRASYSFSNALVDSGGLSTSFHLTAPFTFQSLEPFGYAISMSDATLNMAESAIADGILLNGRISLPKLAVVDSSRNQVVTNYTQLAVDSSLDLIGQVVLAQDLTWGEYTGTQPLRAYLAAGFIWGRFFLSGAYATPYLPIDSSGAFQEPVSPLIQFVTDNLQGVTVYNPRNFIVFTLDTPTKDPILFIATGNTQDRENPQWLNITSDGVSASFPHLQTDPAHPLKDLGPTYSPIYLGQKPFSTIGEKPFQLEIKFVSSAVYESNMNGLLFLPEPTNAIFNFQKMSFTSTANDAGGKLVITNPVKLDYWGLGLVQKPGMSSAGIISVRTGQILLTAAGLTEPRHFSMPFYLSWGEMLANGALGRLFFDYDAVGQQFDGFNYDPSAVKLSAYDTTNPSLPAYLQVTGTIHFDFFGAKYLNIHDLKDDTKPNDPFDGRRVELGADTDTATGILPSDTSLSRNWSGGFGSMNFTYSYDTLAQSGFTGTGTMGFLYVSGLMSASIVLKSTRICMSVNDTNRFDFSIGPIVHFGTMSRVTGCSCLVNGELERAMLSAELEQTADANVALRAASYGRVEFLLTPSISQSTVSGDMYLTIISSGNLEVSGLAKFTINRDQDYAEGEIDADFDTSTLLGLSSISATGQLNWHIGMLGGTSYQSIQGRISVAALTPLVGGSAEGGFYVGLNAPKSDAWVLEAGGDRFKLNITPLPDRLNGVFGYAKYSRSFNYYIFSGGIEAYTGIGGFVLTPQQIANLHAQASGLPVGLPFVIGNIGVQLWGDILGGLVSASGWGDFNVIGPYPFSFQGTIGLEGCALWVACASADVTCGINSSQGFFIQ